MQNLVEIKVDQIKVDLKLKLKKPIILNIYSIYLIT